ncbi:hypothetical protein KY349_01855, partial [Candidatus Woesearchaeota archaeon]|nr:hypothetical protein [Candidatus Woesearchaeota archaeon]
MIFKKGFMFFLALVLLAACVSAAGYKYYIPGAYVNEESTAFVNILNPNDDPAEIELMLYYEKNDSARTGLKVEPHSAASYDLTGRAGTGNFGIIVSSDEPVAVSSVQYDSTYSGGFGSPAATEPSSTWYFAEGYTSGMVKTYIHVLNPSEKETEVDVTLYYDNGEKKTFSEHLPALKSLRIDLKENTMPEKRFGIKLSSAVPVIASTANFNKHFSAGTGGIGSTSTAKRWYFPAGYTSIDATQFLNILNPSLGVSHMTVTLYYSDGSTRSFDETVDPGSKKMILLNNYAEKLEWFSTVVESDVGVVAELTHYDDSYSAGHGGVGSAKPVTTAYFSSGLVDEKVKTSLAVFNPSDKEAELEINFFYSDGSVTVLPFNAPSMMRSTVDIAGKAVEGKLFGINVKSSEPVVVQEFIYDKSYSAGHGDFGVASLPVAEPGVVEVDVEDFVPAPTDEFKLMKEDVVSPSKFKDSVSDDLQKVVKYSYEFEGSPVVAWRFSYGDHDSAADALGAALSGDLFKLLEVGPAEIDGFDANYFAAEKSGGYFWLNRDDLYVFVGSKDDQQAVFGLADMFASSAPQQEKGTGLSTILLIIIGLIVLVFIIRSVFRKEPEEEEAVWEEVIPSAKPKMKEEVKKPVKRKAR